MEFHADPAAIEARIENARARIAGFSRFGDEAWEREEGRYKRELRELFRERLADAPGLEPAEVTRRLVEILRAPLPSTGKPQNLVGWRYARNLADIAGNPADAARLGPVLRGLLAAGGDLAGPVGEVSRVLFELTGDGAFSRSIPTLVAMLRDPAGEILVRTDDVVDASRFLLGEPILARDRTPLDAPTYEQVRAFARWLREELDRRGLGPRDLLDIQGFVWASRDVPAGWIFQASSRGPMDVPRALAEGLDVVYWRLAQHREHVKKGAPAFVWMAGRDGGLLATGWVGSDPLPPAEVPAAYRERERRYRRYERDEGEDDTPMVRVEIERAFPGSPVSRGEFLADPVLRHLALFRSPQGSVFPASPAACRRIAELARDRGERPVATPAPGPVEAGPPPAPSVDEILAALREKGLVFRAETVSAFLLALQVKRFVILTGISGTGKTRLALEVARFHAPPGGPRNHEVIPVRPDWTDGRALLGYVNPLAGRYVETPFLRLLLDARREQERAAAAGRPPVPYFAILDEMNLARVEYYFSDLLSAMESGEEIPLHGDEGIEATQGIPRRAPVPRNLYVVGTVNVDETTFMFSPKVLDRAFTLELDDVDLVGEEDPEDEWSLPELRLEPGAAGRASRADWEAFAGIDGGNLRELVVTVQDGLREHHRHFGYRVANEIARFVLLAHAASGESDIIARGALDLALRAKVLPKFHGTQEELGAALEVLEKLAAVGHAGGAQAGEDVPRSAEPALLPRTRAKARRMIGRLQRQGFTSFIE